MSFVPRALPVLLLLSTLPGCCALATMLCGPDSSAWISERYDTPELTIATFREAVRRNDEAVIARCFSERFKEREGLHGSVDIAVVWDRMSEEIFGLRLLGNAKVGPIGVLPDGRRGTSLEVSGHVILVTVKPQHSWLVRAEPPSGPIERGRYVSSIGDLIRVEGNDRASSIHLTIPESELRSRRLPVLKPDEIDGLVVTREWKIDEVRMPDAGN